MSIKEEFDEVVNKSKKLDCPRKDLLITAFLSEELSKLIIVGGQQHRGMLEELTEPWM